MGPAPRAVATVLVAWLVLSGCTTDSPGPSAPEASRRSTATPSPSGPTPSTTPTATDDPTTTTTATATATDEPTPTATAEPTPTTASFDAAAAMADVRLLAGRIGPRLATGPAYRRAGRLVAQRLAALGYDVRREHFPVPAGDSWGVPVEAGRSFNVVAEPPGFDPARPHVVVGAHLDTIAVAPGAEDNASGVSVLLEVARLAATTPPRQPVVLVAFGAEEPRGSGDDMHHFGSQHHVRQLAPARREALVAMVSLDRVGVGSSVPVCNGPLSSGRVQQGLLRAAERVDVPAAPCENTASDHWSFEKEGFTVARLGSTSYAAYHSPQDLPSVVDQRQLGRTGRVVWEWLR